MCPSFRLLMIMFGILGMSDLSFIIIVFGYFFADVFYCLFGDCGSFSFLSSNFTFFLSFFTDSSLLSFFNSSFFCFFLSKAVLSCKVACLSLPNYPFLFLSGDFVVFDIGYFRG